MTTPRNGRAARHTDRFAALRGADLKTGRAWTIMEDLRHFWSYKRRGYRNREHFKTAIYFHLGGLQLYPATP